MSRLLMLTSAHKKAMARVAANTVLRQLTNRLGSQRQYGSLDHKEFEDSGHRTVVELQSKTLKVQDPLILTNYLVGGFKFEETIVMGPIAIVNKAVFGWNIKHPEEITMESLSLFSIMFPKVDTVVLGTGDHFTPLPKAIHQEMKERGISIEVQRTQNACGVYNLLRGERPLTVGGAFLPITEEFMNNKKSVAAQKRYYLG